MVGRGAAPPPPLLNPEELTSPLDGVTLSPRKSGMRSKFVKKEPPSPIEIMKEWVINSPKMVPSLDPQQEAVDEDEAESYVMGNKNWLLLELGTPKMTNKKVAAGTTTPATSSHHYNHNTYNDDSSIHSTTTSSPREKSLLQEWGQAILACGSDVLKSQQKRLEPALESKHWFNAMHACSPMHEQSERPIHTDMYQNVWDSLDESESASTVGPSPDELGQIRRLTSWGTVFSGDDDTTVGTIPILNDYRSTNDDYYFKTHDNTSIPVPNNNNNNNNNAPLNVSPKAAAAAKQQQQPPLPKRKRVVRFDYPPISSLRECPRAAPEDLENLFFTAQELEMIEEDRFSTMSADDVEIVAISTSGEEESGSERGGAARQAFTFNDNAENRAPRKGGATPGPAPRRKQSNGSRMIKSVQIYLRERSGG